MAASIEQAAGEAGSDALAALLRVSLNDNGTLILSGLLPVLAPAPSGDVTGATDTAALNALMADGAAILLGSGVYWVNAALTPTTHCALVGRGQNLTQIKRAANVPVISQVGTNAVPLRNLVLSGMTIDGNTGQGFTATLVQQSFLRDPVMRDVTIFGAEGIGWDQLEVWDCQTDNVIVSSCGGNSAGAFPAHRIECSVTDTSNNIHLRGYRNESYGPDGALLVTANGANIPKNIELVDFKIEKHGNVGIIMNVQQAQGFHMIGGTMPVTGGLAAGVVQGVDLCSFPGCEDVQISDVFHSVGTFAANDVRSLFNFDGSVNAIDGVTLKDIRLHQGTGSQPLEDVRFAGTVNSYNERGVSWNSGHSWTNPHWTGTPTTHGAFAVKGRQTIQSGTVTYTPTPGTLAILVECIAGGGGGGGTTTAASSAASGGGGGGGYSVSYILNPGTQPITVAVGGQGTAGAATGGNGGTGGDTSFNSGAVLAKGGGGGLGQAAGTALLYAAGGGGGLESAGAGDVKLRGGPGEPGVTNTGLIGGSGAGGDGAGALGGGGGVGKIAAGAGVGGGTYGAGGSGGLVLNNSAAVAGGAGSAGLMVITEYGN